MVLGPEHSGLWVEEMNDVSDVPHRDLVIRKNSHREHDQADSGQWAQVNENAGVLCRLHGGDLKSISNRYARRFSFLTYLAIDVCRGMDLPTGSLHDLVSTHVTAAEVIACRCRSPWYDRK